MTRKLFTTAIVSIICVCLLLTACTTTGGAENQGDGTADNVFVNPGDSLGGGGTASETVATASMTAVLQSIDALDDNITADEKSASLDGISYTTIVLADGGSSVITGDGATATASGVTITAAGNYVISGSLSNGQIVAEVSGDVHLFLNGVSISYQSGSSTEGAAIVLKKSGVKTITVLGENSVSESDTTGETNAAIYCTKSLIINGDGTLNVTGNTKNGIHAKETLKLTDVTLVVSALNHAVRGNYGIIIDGCDITATSTEGDGLHAESGLDSKLLGFVSVVASNLTITSGDDGIQASTFIDVAGDQINVTAGGGSPANITDASSDAASGKGLKAGTIEIEEGETVTEITDASYYAIRISGGTIIVNSNDDALHSNGYLFISGGKITLKSGDDGVHADEYISVSGGEINVEKSYEGVEAAKIEISGGTVDVTTTDDGVNAADGTTNAVGSYNKNCYIYISGGKVTVNAQGDGVDSNGTILISGGEVCVNGPTGNGDGSLDSDGGILITGGSLIAVGSLGMVETPGSNSTQNIISFASKTAISAGTILTVTDSDGNTLCSMTTKKACYSVIISCAGLTTGGSYKIYGGDTLLATAVINSTITSVGTTTTSNNPGGGFRPNR